MPSTADHNAASTLAQRAAAAMWASDHASQGLGIEIIEAGPGTATVGMTIQPSMVNGHGMAHGGSIFTLADTAFAYACNSTGETTVAAQCAITFIRPGQLGARLTATAREISRTGRSGIYDVQVRDGDTVIAEFRGHSRAIGGSFLTIESQPSASGGEGA
jgi:acyl-CoA thioesterase